MADIEGHGAVGPVQFLRNLYQARELFAGIQLFATSHTVAALEEAIARGGLATALHTGELASSSHFTAATLVFPFTKQSSTEPTGLLDLSDALEAPDFAPDMDSSPNGLHAAALLRQWAYGTEAEACPLVHTMIKGTLEQAEACVAACTAALLDCVTPSTCLSLLALAERCGCGPLYCVALRCALDNFTEAVREDAAGLRLLSSTQMARLLGSDALAVASEFEAFEGLAAWVEADATNRLAAPLTAFKQPSTFATLLQNSVRLCNMTYEELERVDQAPVTARDKKAIGTVAMAIIEATNGLAGDVRPRRPRGPAAMRDPFLPEVLKSGKLLVDKNTLKRAAAAAADGDGCVKKPRGADDEATDMLVSPTRPVQVVTSSGVILPAQRALFSNLIEN